MKKTDYRKIIHIGDKFSKLTVVDLPEDINCRSKIHCKCECGRDAFTRIDNLLSGHSSSCSCCNGKPGNLQIGDRFGRLTVVNLPHKPVAKSYAVCICDCGKEISICINNLIYGKTQSCGCLKSEKSSERIDNLQKFNHDRSIFQGDSGNEYHRIVRSFLCMYRRVNKNEHYISRGITVDPVWSYTKEGYNNFKLWMMSELLRLDVSLQSFSESGHQLSVDRIDNNSSYSPVNCRLATPKQQNRNTSATKRFYNDKHILDYADEYGLNYGKAIRAFDKGLFPELLAGVQ